MKHTILLSIAFLTVAEVSAQEGAPSFLKARQAPDASFYLPAPPDTSSVAYLADFNKYQWGRAQRTTIRGRQADYDTYWQADSILKGYAHAFGLAITPTATPQTYALMCKVCVDAELGVTAAKRRYMRKRPYVQYNEHTGCPAQEEELRHTGSYPSGHSARGWATALVLAELRPDRQNQILERGYQYGESRVIEGYHYESDVEAARLAASAVVARLHADETFMLQLSKAKKELSRLIHPSTLNLSQYELNKTFPLKKDSIQAFQGMAINGKYLVSLQNRGLVTIYELPAMKKITETFHLGCYSVYNHTNVAAFGCEKYAKTDTFPLLYVSQAYRKPVNGKKDICYVERISLDGSSTTVQTIHFDDSTHLFGYALQWTIDQKNHHLIGFGNTRSNKDPKNQLRIIIFQLPTLAMGNEVHLKVTDAIECYTIQQYDGRYPSCVVGQGACVYDDCLILPTGFGIKAAPSILYVWDMHNKTIVDVLDYSGRLDHEMEDVDFYNGDCYIQTNGAGIVKFSNKK